MREKEVIVAGYCRVSTPMQVDGLSLDVQQEQIEKYIRSRGWKLYKIFIETGYSGKDFERPRFQEMLRHLHAGKFGVIVVPKIDRFARNIRLLLEIVENDLKPNNVQLVSVSENIDTTNPAGNTLFQIMGIFAAMERERISERITDSHRKKALTGPVGGSKLGYKFDKNGECRIDSKGADVVRMIFRLYVKENQTPVQIANHLREKDIKSVYEKYMCFRVIQRILKNEAYIGRFIYGRKKIINGKVVRMPESEWIIVERKDLAIIDKKTFSAAQRKLQKNKRQYDKSRGIGDGNKPVQKTPYENLLERDMVTCGHCSGRMGTRKPGYQPRKAVSPSYSYFCTTREQFGKSRCSARSVKSGLIDPVVEERIGELIDNKHYVRIVKSRIKEMSKPQSADQKKEIAGLKAKIAKLNEKLARINSLGSTTRLVESQAQQKAVLEKEKMKLLLTIADKEMDMIQNGAPLFNDKHFELLSGNFSKTFKKLPLDKKKAFIASIVKKVVIKDREILSVELHPPFDIEKTGHFDEH
ncbi:MAG: recombinase family protein [Victivallales bacterium]